MRNKLCRTFYPWCPGVKTRCLCFKWTCCRHIFLLYCSCLHKSTGVIMLKPGTTCRVTLACAVLHNMCIRARLPLPDLIDRDDQQVAPVRQAVDARGGINTRANVIQTFFWTVRTPVRTLIFLVAYNGLREKLWILWVSALTDLSRIHSHGSFWSGSLITGDTATVLSPLQAMQNWLMSTQN